MGLFSYLCPSSRPQLKSVKVKTDKFCRVVKRRSETSFDRLYSNISLFLAALCVFEAAVWLTTASPETANNELRRSYLEHRVQGHSVVHWNSQIVIDPIYLIRFTVLLIQSQLLVNQYLQSFKSTNSRQIDKYKDSSKLTEHPNTQVDQTVREFLIILSSPKKSKKWIQ